MLDLPGDAHTPEQYAVIVAEQYIELGIILALVLIHRRRADEMPVVFSA